MITNTLTTSIANLPSYTIPGETTNSHQLQELLEWKQKAKVQLEYFKMACTLYNLCNTERINELLES
jgi:hypothetical protein